MFPETRSYLARCQSRSRPRNKRMSALGPDSTLLGFIPAYLHVSISSPTHINGAASDFLLLVLLIKFLEVSQRRAP